MKKTISINFQGQLITIEETAFDVLSAYIEKLKEYFKNEAEGDEIVNDIKGRIAELFGNRLKHGTKCITDADVESVIEAIGQPEEFDIDYNVPSEEHSAPPNQEGVESQMPPPVDDKNDRRLYRRSNDKMIGGVSSGIAHYLKIDPLFVRLLFVISGSFLFWVYIILWIVLPEQSLENNLHKRFYRNPDDKYIGGVSGGIAAYFQIESWIPRVIFLLPVIVSLVGVMRFPFISFNKFAMGSPAFWGISSSINFSFFSLYILLWIIMPKAITAQQKCEMMGEEVYIHSIRSKVSRSRKYKK